MGTIVTIENKKTEFSKYSKMNFAAICFANDIYAKFPIEWK